jgi:hypothetical protein
MVDHRQRKIAAFENIYVEFVLREVTDAARRLELQPPGRWNFG